HDLSSTKSRRKQKGEAAQRFAQHTNSSVLKYGIAEARIQDSTIDDEIKKQIALKEFLNVKWDLRAIYVSVVGEPNFDSEIGGEIVIWMGIKSNGDGNS